ncbi:MAG: PAS domain S-box protein [Gammaproteobacteria bacterium]|nr:PAS domain S-box protein [Gammaproteobacteria bacterium]
MASIYFLHPARLIFLTAALGALAFLGTMASLPLFFGVSIIFGSIAVMIAVPLLGTGPAIMVSLIGGLYTLVLWGHPYALLIFCVEATVVGVLYKRGWKNLVLTDLFYWLFIGTPLVLIFYRGIIDMTWEATTLIAFKQAVNGVFNALIASLINFSIRHKHDQTSIHFLDQNQLSNFLFYVLLLIIILSSSIPILHESHAHRQTKENELAVRLHDRLRHIELSLSKIPYVDPASARELLKTIPVDDFTGIRLLHDSAGVLADIGKLSNTSTAGEFQSTEYGVDLWLPVNDLPAMVRWSNGHYRASSIITVHNQPIQIAIEYLAEPVVSDLQQHSRNLFVFLAAITLAGLLLSSVASQWVARPLTRLSRVASQTTNAVIITDKSGCIDWVNDGFTRITGYSAEEVRGRKPGDFLQGPDTDTKTVTTMRQALEQRLAFNADVINYTKAGTPYWIRIDCNPIFDSNGSFQGFLAIELDVTPQKLAQEKLRQSEDSFRSVFEHAGDAIYIHDQDGRIIDVNHAASLQTGYSHEELLAISIHDLNGGDVINRDELNAFWASAGDNPGMFPQTVPASHRKKNGDILPVDVTVNLLKDGDNNMFVAIVRDVTERDRVEKLKSEFISTVSHELRTPLTSISGALALTLHGTLGEINDDVRSLLTIANNNSQRLTHIINDLLDLEKAVVGKMHFDIKPHKLSKLVDHGIKSAKIYSSDKNIEIVTRLNDANTRLLVDDHRFNQVLTNLLSNAIKFSPENGQVVISSWFGDGAMKISVSDQGPGIPDKFKPMVFQKFTQADASSSRRISGTGLGLAISKELTERMNGSIGFDSATGQGTTFYIVLPTAH